MNSFVFLAPIACLFGIIALTSLVWSVRGSRFDATNRKAQPARIASKAANAAIRRNH